MPARKGQRGQPILEYAPRPPVPWGLIHLFVFGFLMIGIQSFLASYWGVDLKSEDADVLGASQENMLFASGASRLLTVPIIFGAIMLMSRGTLTDLGIVPRKIHRDVLVGVSAFAMIAPIVFGLQLLLTKFFKSQHPLIEWLTERPTMFFLYMVAFSAVVVAPIAEEVLFRLLLQGWFEKIALRKFSGRELVFGQSEVGLNDFSAPLTEPKKDSADGKDGPNATHGKESGNPFQPPLTQQPAKLVTDKGEVYDDGRLPSGIAMLPILGSSLVFALMHYSHGPDPIPLFLLSLGIGYVYQRTHRILPCILIHMLLNGFSMVLLWLQLFGGKS